VYGISQVRRCLAIQIREDKARQFEVNSFLNWKPVQLVRFGPTSGPSEKPNGSILDRLDFPNQAVRYAVQCRSELQ